MIDIHIANYIGMWRKNGGGNHCAVDLRQRDGKAVVTLDRILAARRGSVP